MEAPLRSPSSLSSSLSPFLGDLLPELRILIIEKLPLKAVVIAMRVCQAWYVHFQRDEYWRWYMTAQLGISSIFESSESYRLVITAGLEELESYYSWLAAAAGIPVTSVLRSTRRCLKLKLQLLEVLVGPKYVPDHVPLIDHIHCTFERHPDADECEKLLRTIFRLMVVHEPMLGLATSDIESCARVCEKRLPILRLATFTSMGQGGSSYATFLEFGFVTKMKLRVIIQGTRGWGEVAHLDEMDVALDWSTSIPELADRSHNVSLDMISKFLSQHLLISGGQHPYGIGTLTTRINMNWLQNPYWTVKEQDSQGVDVRVYSKMDGSREHATASLQEALARASRHALRTSGLPLLDGNATVLGRDIVKLLDHETAERMCGWLDACTDRFDLSAVASYLKLKTESELKEPRKVNRFAAKPKDGSRVSATPQIALMTATKRALQCVMRPLLLCWRSVFSDTSSYQGTLDALVRKHASDPQELSYSKIALRESYGKYWSMLLHVPATQEDTKRHGRPTPLPCHRMPLQYFSICCELTPHMAALMCSHAVCYASLLDLEGQRIVRARAVEAMQDVLRLSGVEYLGEELNRLIEMLHSLKTHT